MNSLREIFSKNIKRLRVEKNISQEELAFLCGLHRTYISDIERATRNVSIDNIEKIADALNVPVVELLKEEK
ncbi:MAG: putative BamHI control element [Herbinix sp.]|jgi:transcriptional regulator with XRE-family HTH domain|nr:putative BamHI control element [Anaerocolumna sp.]MDF2844698.1 putative BamHI control element [Herbinix sp.]